MLVVGVAISLKRAFVLIFCLFHGLYVFRLNGVLIRPVIFSKSAKSSHSLREEIEVTWG